MENQIAPQPVAHLTAVQVRDRGRQWSHHSRRRQGTGQARDRDSPDFLANAGGVTCSYFEQVQSNMNFFWPHDEVLGRLDTTMTNAFRSVSALAQSRNLSLRDAAYVIAVDRVARACKDRGWV